MQKRVILTFHECGYLVGTRPAIVSTEDIEKLKDEVWEYNKQIVALTSGTADPSAYEDAGDRMMLAAVAAGKGHGAMGALYPRWCYEEFDWRFDLVEVDPAWTPEKELPVDSNYNEWTLDGTFGEGELGDMLVKPFDTLFSASLGYRVLPTTQKAFERECGKITLKQSMEVPDKTALIPDEVKSEAAKSERFDRILTAGFGDNSSQYGRGLGQVKQAFLRRTPEKVTYAISLVLTNRTKPAYRELVEHLGNLSSERGTLHRVKIKVNHLSPMQTLSIQSQEAMIRDRGSNSDALTVTYKDMPCEQLLTLLDELKNQYHTFADATLKICIK